jgi:hypothetical protein
LEPNNVPLPTYLPRTNKRKFYLCASAFKKKWFLSFLALEKSKIAPQRREETQRKFYLCGLYTSVVKKSPISAFLKRIE